MGLQLRRIGAPATLSGVKNIMKLRKPVTRFGRHTQSDYFLDSLDQVCLISRVHAEIYCEQKNDDVIYSIKNQGLNGTFVNDVKVEGIQEISEGDIITFGHPQGRSLAFAAYAPQVISEFKFVVEHVPPDPPPSSDATEVASLAYNHNIPTSQTDTTGPPSGNPTTPAKPLETDTTTLMNPFLDVENPDSPIKTIAQSDLAMGLVSARNASCPQPRVSPAKTILHLKDISNRRKQENLPTTSRLVPLDELMENCPQTTLSYAVPQAKDESSNSAFDDVFATAVDRAKTFQESESESDDDISIAQPDKKRKLELQFTPTPGVDCPTSLMDPNSMFVSRPVPALTPPRPMDPTTFITSSVQTACHPSTSFQQQASACSSRTPLADAIAVNPVEKKPRMKRKTRVSQSASGRKSQGKKGGRKSHEPEKKLDDSMLEVSFHRDGDQCDSYDCICPVAETVTWVQCDDCDGWFHTICVGTDPRAVQAESAEFHCGCM